MPPDPVWSKKQYPTNAEPPEVTCPRPLYPPDAADHGKTPSPHGPDLIAYKRSPLAGRPLAVESGRLGRRLLEHLRARSEHQRHRHLGSRRPPGTIPAGSVRVARRDDLRDSPHVARPEGPGPRPRGRAALRFGFDQAPRQSREAVRKARRGREGDPCRHRRILREGRGERAALALLAEPARQGRYRSLGSVDRVRLLRNRDPGLPLCDEEDGPGRLRPGETALVRVRQHRPVRRRPPADHRRAVSGR